MSWISYDATEPHQTFTVWTLSTLKNKNETERHDSFRKSPQICYCAFSIPMRTKERWIWKTKHPKQNLKHNKIHETQKTTRKSSEVVMNLKRGELANMKQQHTRSRTNLNGSTQSRWRQQMMKRNTLEQHATIATAAATHVAQSSNTQL